MQDKENCRLDMSDLSNKSREIRLVVNQLTQCRQSIPNPATKKTIDTLIGNLEQMHAQLMVQYPLPQVRAFQNLPAPVPAGPALLDDMSLIRDRTEVEQLVNQLAPDLRVALARRYENQPLPGSRVLQDNVREFVQNQPLVVNKPRLVEPVIRGLEQALRL